MTSPPLTLLAIGSGPQASTGQGGLRGGAWLGVPAERRTSTWPYRWPPPSKPFSPGGEPPEVTPMILADDAALRDVEPLDTATDNVRCGHPDIAAIRAAKRSCDDPRGHADLRCARAREPPWAFCSLRGSPGATAYYQQLRTRRIGHQAALRQPANRLVGILHGWLKIHATNDEHTAWAHILNPAA